MNWRCSGILVIILKYSGSWDHPVRCYRRGSWDCIRWAVNEGVD
jgi:hypothetical protein